MKPADQLDLSISDGVAQLSWGGPVNPGALARQLGQAAASLFSQGIRRIEVMVDTADSRSIHALHLAHFRREGRRRQVWPRQADWADAWIYSLLADDTTSDPVTFSSVMDTVLPTHRVIGHVILGDGGGRILLVETTYKPDWELPGGVIEPNEPPRIGAERELAEELGLRIRLGQPLVVDWMPPYLGWSDAIEFIFDGGVLGQEEIGAIRLADHEVAAIHWVDVDQLANHVFPLSARRISHLLASGHDVYIENGQAIRPDDSHLPASE